MLRTPAKQTATDTISTLSSRLANATLLEDRRAAILGLRSFAKEYPASVASGSLRHLIGSLTKDADDVDTTKVVLETLLMLFNPNERSPEASEDIALWLADEFTQRQDNITILLDLLETHDFYPRLYSLQLLSAITALRPERTQECILSAPLGTTRLVAVLDDPRDAVRNAGLLLLTDLTQSSTELQKLVAFENAFERIFNLIQLEGSLSEGSIVVQDCLSLLANLIRCNASNQSLFRETGYVTKLAGILPGSTQGKLDDEAEGWANPQKDKNMWGLLAVLRMFLTRGSTSTQQNQVAFQRHGLVQLVLNLAFSQSAAVSIKAEALYTCADMIRGNPKLQEGFAQLQVASLTGHASPADGKPQVNGTSRAYVIDALLDLALGEASGQLLDARFAACECIKAYFWNHTEIRLHFLHRAISGHTSRMDDTANVLTTLIQGHAPSGEPYGIWFAALLLFDLIFGDIEAKNVLMAVAEGDAESGEEVVTCIQAMVGNLISALQTSDDERIAIGYFMLLCGWLFEDGAAVNDFLGEGSSLQILMQTASKTTSLTITRGLSAVLLGIIYEFSTKDSPIPRRKLQLILTSGLGRERYIEAITRLRQHPSVRDFEINNHTTGGSPNVLFDTAFIDFLKDNISRFTRAIDRDPGVEVVVGGAPEGIDRDLVDSLRAQIEDKTQSLQKAQSDLLALESRLEQAQVDHRKTQETSIAELNRIKGINEALQRSHDEDMRLAAENAEARLEESLQELEEQHHRQFQDLHARVQQSQKDATERAEAARANYEQEIGRLNQENADLRSLLDQTRAERLVDAQLVEEMEQAAAKARDDLAAAHRTIESLSEMIHTDKDLIAELRRDKSKLEEAREADRTGMEGLQVQLQAQATAIQALKEKLEQAEKAVSEKEEARSAAQTELDDLFMVLSELEEKRARDKRRLKALGEEVSDVEDEGGEEEDDGEEDEREEGGD